jgi:hypothetical protein
MQMRISGGALARAALVGLLAVPTVVSADVTTERPASILVWPKVISNEEIETTISLTNTSNSLVRAHCFYVNAALRDPTENQGPLNPPLWQEIDFTITLTRQQPTYWSVSQGRRVNPFDGLCNTVPPSTRNLAGLSPDECYPGFDPGLIPPVVPDFSGELKCIEVDDSGAPFAGNHLKGEARMSDREVVGPPMNLSIIIDGVSTYNAIGVLGIENNGDGTLVLGGGQCVDSAEICNSDEDCGEAGPCIFEYNACPHTWILNHVQDGAPNLALETPEDETLSVVFTGLTIVPCTQNFETQIPTSVTIQFLTFNEFEQQISYSTTVTCWGNFPVALAGGVGLIFGFPDQLPDPQGTMYLQTRMRSAEGTPYGFFAVAEELHVAEQSAIAIGGGEEILFRRGTRAAFNLVVEGDRTTPDVITVPADQLAP